MSSKVKHFIVNGAMVACYLASGYLMSNHYGYSLAFVILGSFFNKVALDSYKEIQ